MTSVAGKGPSGGAPYGAPGPRKQPFRHIDDIVSVTIEIDPHTPLHKVLETGDSHMRQAISFNNFHRPDLALQEYIKAFTIAVDKVPKHKDYPSLKSDRGDLNRLYGNLKVKITANGATFDKIKELIKEDNLKSGARSTRNTPSSLDLMAKLPSVPSAAPSTRPTSNGSASRKDSLDQNIGAGSKNGLNRGTDGNAEIKIPNGPKAKPAVHPKPQSLLGKSLNPTTGSAVSDLAARFAKLRDPQESQTRASLDSLPKSGSARSISPRPSLDTTMPIMPRIPDAIYSPARGTVTSEVANLPSSTPRGMFSRTNSMVSIPGTPRISMDSAPRAYNTEQFAAAHTYGEVPNTPSTTKIRIPRGDTISVAELLRCMGHGVANVKILIIDVRDRGSFDEGHILSQNTICIDPTILSRDDISADEIVDSMILATSKEKKALEERDQADLVVFYDQDSSSMPTRSSNNPQRKVLYNLHQALSHYSELALKHTPKLLVGGLDAWVSEMGEQSLETSNTQFVENSATELEIRTLQRLRRRTLKPTETNDFEKIIGNFARSTEDFMKRYPTITTEPESMISEGTPDGILKDMDATPPVRPRPSVPRTRYSGLQPASGAVAMMADAGARGYPTGLRNPHNWCYANAGMQMLVASAGFVDELTDPAWPAKYRPDAPNNHPAYNQLMCKILGNLLHWLTQRAFESMEMTTLMQYLRTIHAGYPINNNKVKFGDTNQHDSDEFILFLFGQLSAETRIPLTKNNLPALNKSNLADFVMDAWGNRDAHTIIHRHFFVMEVFPSRCLQCLHETFTSDYLSSLSIPVQEQEGDLVDLLQQRCVDEEFPVDCDECKHKGKRRTQRIARLPPLLRIQLIRNGGQAGANKDTTKISFPFEKLDMQPFSLPASERMQIARRLGHEAGEGFNVATTYDLYGVVMHSGKTAQSGHYTAYVNPSGKKDGWFYCNDTVVTPLMQSQAQKGTLTHYRGHTPTQLYYRRTDVAISSKMDGLSSGLNYPKSLSDVVPW